MRFFQPRRKRFDVDQQDMPENTSMLKLFETGSTKTYLQGRRRSYHEIVHVRTVQFPGRLFPLVLLENGQPGYVINAYLNYLLMRGEQESTFRQKMHAVCQLYEFCRRTYGDNPLSEENTRSLIFQFGSAKLHGTIQPDGHDPLNLYWRPVLPRTLKNILRYIDEFDAFQVTHFQAASLNPVEILFQTTFQRYQEFKTRTRYDPFIHLFPSRSKERRISAYTAKEHQRNSQPRRHQKVFPSELIVEMIERTPEPRDKMLLLLMAFGGLRRSEPLHIFHQDVLGQFRDSAAAWIRLSDPVRGVLKWIDSKGIERDGTRAEFHHDVYENHHLPSGHPLRNLQPRCLYGLGSAGLYAGFKGMTFTGHGDENFVFWLHEEAGVYFWRLYEQYVANHFHAKPNHWPYHPYLFIRLDAEGYGMPLTLAAMDKLFARAAERIGISGFGAHSLRHLYGYYMASVLKLSVERAQVCMHHASIQSTQIYYRTAPEVIRREILIAAYQSTGRPIPLSLQKQSPVSVFSFPIDWHATDEEIALLKFSFKRLSQ